MDSWTKENKKKGDEYYKAGLLNKSLCFLKLENWYEARQMCDVVLKECDSRNEKASKSDFKNMFTKKPGQFSYGRTDRYGHKFRASINERNAKLRKNRQHDEHPSVSNEDKGAQETSEEEDEPEVIEDMREMD